MVYHLQNSALTCYGAPEGMYLRMTETVERLDTLIKPALRQRCKDKVVIDLGCGSGILGMYALEYGASFVYFVEQSGPMVEILRNSLHKVLDASKFKIIHKYAQDLKVEDFDCGIPELCVSELLGPQLFDEGYYQCTYPLKQIFEHLEFIPEVFHLDVYESDPNFDDWPWPQREKIILEQCKYTYSTIGWSTSTIGIEKPINIRNKRYIGEISYNATEGTFKNSVKAVIKPTKGKMITLYSKTMACGLIEYASIFGWYVYPNENDVEVELYVLTGNDRSNVIFTSKLYQP